jgi:hypothetical protein
MKWKQASHVFSWLIYGFILYFVIYFTKGGNFLWDSTSWKIVEAIATWLLALGIVYALIQINEARKSTNAQIAAALYKELRSDKALHILRYIYSLEPGEDGKLLTSEHRNDIDYILDNLGIVGRLIIQGIVDEDLAIEAFGGVPALRCWYQLVNYVIEERGKRGKQFGSYFEDFACRALKHFKKRKKNWILFYHNISEPFDLIEKLYKDQKLKPKLLNKQKD